MQGQEESNLLTLYSDVRATSVRWLWYPYIAIGKITLLQGDPGDGKSTMMSLISEVSNGGLTPDGKEIGRPQRVIYTRLSERSCLPICEIRPSQSGRTALPSTRPALRGLRTLYIST